MRILGKYHSRDIHEWTGDDGKTQMSFASSACLDLGLLTLNYMTFMYFYSLGVAVDLPVFITTSRRFKCVPQILGLLSIHIFKLLFFLITNACRLLADQAVCVRRAQTL